jgi:hypothetical protein
MKNSRQLNRSIQRRLDRHEREGFRPDHRPKDHLAEFVPLIRRGLGGRCNVPQEAVSE